MNLFDYTYDLVRQIPPGKVSTYGAVAIALGDIKASRAVGRMMNQNPNADDMPCFKIVYSDGKLGGFGLGINDKIRRLRNDKIKVRDGKIVDFENVFFDEFKTNYPLNNLRQQQIDLSKNVKINDEFIEIETIAGFDVAYPKNEFDDVCGAYVLIDFKSNSIVEEKTFKTKIDFPYIPTYFAFREYPVLNAIFNKIDNKPSVIMLDGNGILHPIRFGYASYAGIMLDIPTIGVAKNLLYGKIENNNVMVDNQVIGSTIFSKNSKKPIFISPGHKVTLDTSVSIVKKMQIHKIPEPLRLAHNLAISTLNDGI
jgi:deoxyribonuclease V